MKIFYRDRILPLNRQSNVIYSDNNWEDIVKDYKLFTEMEIVIREDHQTEGISNKPVSQPHQSKWLLRTFLITGSFAILGNLPVQSHLLTPVKTSTTLNVEVHPHTNQDRPNVKNDKNKEQVVKITTNIKSQAISRHQLSHTTTTNNVENEIDAHELVLPKRALETYAGHVIENNSSKWKTYHVKSYDNLTNIFHKIGHQQLLKTFKKDKDINTVLKQLKKGSIVRASSKEGHLDELVLSNGIDKSYVITQNDGKYTGTWKPNVFEVRQSRSSFTIRNGLFFDGRKSGIDNAIIKQVVKVFDWDIDFSHDVRVGDKVTAVFEEIYHDGDKVGVRNLLAAEFINKGREFRAIRYTNLDGKADYFTPQGREMKKAFIRTPIAHARVSSHFNPGRFHPVLHKIKAHKGTDFAARPGTPIMATGNGTIKFIGRKGGYGRAIVIKHREGYTTLYAHMSRFKKGLRIGDKVYQGDTIGYVGSSGLATGPHLHYEFRKNGLAMDSMRAALPNSMSLSSRELQDFRNKAINLVLQLNVLHRFVKAKIEINSAIGG